MDQSKKLPPTPAAILAAVSGDLENYSTARTPGGIEAQEAAGQTTLVANSTLPIDMPADAKKNLEECGFKFGEKVDDLFVTVTMPPGWRKVPTSHSMWTELHDDKGRRRASIFYKAAFYDKRADLRMDRRYALNNYADSADEEQYETVATDCGKTIHSFGTRVHSDFDAGDGHALAAEAWLNEHFPNWRSPFAYWD